MNNLKKDIVENLEQSNFYDALIYLKQLENNFPTDSEILFFYYYLYDLMEWVSCHKQESSKEDFENNKNDYFKKILNSNQNNKSVTYLKLYQFLEKNFRTFEHLTWIRKNDKFTKLLKQSLKEDANNIEAQLYLLFTEGQINECLSFFEKNEIEHEIVENFIDRIWLDEKFLDASYQLLKQHNLNKNFHDLDYHRRKKDYSWLYKYFNENDQEKFKNIYISYGEVCFYLEKYDEAVDHYNKKPDKKNNDFFVLGQCYEKLSNKEKAIESYEKYYDGFTEGYWHKGIEKLFELKAYEKIELILENENLFVNREYKNFYEAKILNIHKKYRESINQLSGILDKLNSHHGELKKDIYLLIISNFYEVIKKFLGEETKGIIESKNFELENIYGLNYKHLSSYNEMQNYIKKINIEYENKFLDKTGRISTEIHNFYIQKNKEIYLKSQKLKIILSENIELYYLSGFDDINSLDRSIDIYKNKLIDETENPKYHLNLGKLYYEKSKLENSSFSQSIQYLRQAINFSEKYNVYMNGEAELLLIKISEQNVDNRKELFDKCIRDFICYNSYQKNYYTAQYFEGILYKYRSFSINILSSLAESYLYFPSPDQLNDPFDVPSTLLEEQFNELKLNKNDFKLCSLSKNNDNKLMWSHYTQDHKGICIGYKFLYLPNDVGKEEIKYKNTTLAEKNIFESIIDYWTVKSEDWMYEREVRLLHYGDRQKIPYTFDINEALEKKIIALKVESIVLGLNFQYEDIIKPIFSVIEKKQAAKIKIYKAKADGQNLSLALENIQIK